MIGGVVECLREKALIIPLLQLYRAYARVFRGIKNLLAHIDAAAMVVAHFGDDEAIGFVLLKTKIADMKGFVHRRAHMLDRDWHFYGMTAPRPSPLLQPGVKRTKHRACKIVKSQFATERATTGRRMTIILCGKRFHQSDLCLSISYNLMDDISTLNKSFYASNRLVGSRMTRQMYRAG